MRGWGGGGGRRGREGERREIVIRRRNGRERKKKNEREEGGDKGRASVSLTGKNGNKMFANSTYTKIKMRAISIDI